jgi:hypothetical protein
MSSGQGNDQFDQQRSLFEETGTQLNPAGVEQSGNRGATGSNPNVGPSQSPDRSVVTGEPRLRRLSPTTSVDLSGSSLDPNVDYFNRKISKMNPKRLHEIMMRYHQTFDFNEFVENISYQGFNRSAFINAAITKITVSQFSRLAVMGAIRGSNFAKIEANSLRIDGDLRELVRDGTIVKTPKKKNDISILRCTASIPQWCAFFMMSANVPPKIPDSNLPPYLQFPSAASLPMSSDLRRQHIEFSIKFSMLIGGNFNANIYLAAFNNPIPMSEIPDVVKGRLGVSSNAESMQISTQGMIKEISSALIKQ